MGATIMHISYINYPILLFGALMLVRFQDIYHLQVALQPGKQNGFAPGYVCLWAISMN
jgi:hypothetical protein